MKYLVGIFAFALLFTSCKDKFPEDTPECIVSKAEGGDVTNGYDYKYVYKYIKKDGQGITTPLEYYRFESNGENVIYDELVDRTCNIICNPQKGVYSGTTGDCVAPLFQDPQEWTLIWTNSKAN